VEQAYSRGIINDEAHNKYLEGRESYLIKHLTLMKNNDMNICRKCEQKYHIRGNRPGMCYHEEGVHEAQYDFT
jgi:hypothetical protein